LNDAVASFRLAYVKAKVYRVNESKEYSTHLRVPMGTYKKEGLN